MTTPKIEYARWRAGDLRGKAETEPNSRLRDAYLALATIFEEHANLLSRNGYPS